MLRQTVKHTWKTQGIILTRDPTGEVISGLPWKKQEVGCEDRLYSSSLENTWKDKIRNVWLFSLLLVEETWYSPVWILLVLEAELLVSAAWVLQGMHLLNVSYVGKEYYMPMSSERRAKSPALSGMREPQQQKCLSITILINLSTMVDTS